MGNLSIILFISFSAPLIMSILICAGKSRNLLGFMFIGTIVCLFCGEFSTIIFNVLNVERTYYVSNITPIFEEIFKAVPIVVYALLYKPDRRTLLECALLVGVGFAVLENAFMLAKEASVVSIAMAVVRGFGAGMMHGVCTSLVGFGMSFVYSRKRMLYSGTIALLAMAITYHSIYNTLVLSEYQMVGFVLPALTFLPELILIKSKERL